MKKTHGVTLVEILIAAGLMAVILAIVIPYIQDAKKQAAMSSMMGTLRQEAQLALRAIEKDISAARVIKRTAAETDNIYKEDGEHTLQYKPVVEFEDSDPESTTLKITTSKDEMEDSEKEDLLMFDSEDDDIGNYHEVIYSIDKPTKTLKRTADNQSIIVAKHIKSLNQITDDQEARDDGKIGITVTFSEEVPITHKIATHTESLLISVRQLQAKLEKNNSVNYDSRRNKRWRQKYD